jgi:hypothetical protein
MKELRLEVLVLDGCPNVDITLQRVRTALAEAEVAADVQIVRVTGDDEARRLRFLGSPTVRVEGVDVEPASASRQDFGMQCRIYAVNGRFEGTPPTDWIAAALRTRTQR